MIGEGDCGAIGGMKIGRGTEVLGEYLPQRHFVFTSIYSVLFQNPRLNKF
jgi:hypothetical protein